MEDLAEYNEQEMSEPGRPMWKYAVTYGLYYAILSIVITVIMYITGSMMAKSVQWITSLVMLATIVLIQLHYRKTLRGSISYGQSLGVAVLSMVFAAIPIAIFTWALYKFIDPGLLDMIRLTAEEQLVEQGLSEAQIDAALTISSKFQTPAILAVSQFFNLPFMGVIIGLISSIFIKKQNPDKIFE